MKVYVDSSVLLRVVLGERRALRAWPRITRPISSELIRIECLRTIDRARIRFRLTADEVARRRSDVLRRIEAFALVRIDDTVKERAAEPFPTLVGTLDALHLASALLARAQVPDLRFATHDDELAAAARSEGFDLLE